MRKAYFISFCVVIALVGLRVSAPAAAREGDYAFSFRARVPEDAAQVQLWAQFRVQDRFDKYWVGLKGGLQDELYLMRQGYLGTDQLMGVRPLGFHPLPGQWYRVKVEACGPRIRVFVGDEPKPYIDVKDPDWELAASGPVELGGGWIPAEYAGLEITPLAENALDGILDEEFSLQRSSSERAAQRLRERAEYTPLSITLDGPRTEVSLDGNWLFMPDYEASGSHLADPSVDDASWHVMTVPSFWNPIRIWLHGETMPSPRGAQPKGVSDTYYQSETARCDGYSFEWRKVRSAWYRQWIDLPEDIRGKHLTLDFDAVSKIGEVYVNGVKAGEHIGMFGPFSVDGSAFHPGRNLVAVKVTRDYGNAIENADEVVDVAASVFVTNRMVKDLAHGMYGGDPAGIWQKVTLTVTDPVKVEDVFIQPTLEGAAFEMTLSNYGRKKEKVTVWTDIIDKESGAVLYTGRSLTADVPPGALTQSSWSVEGLSPRPWSPQHSVLYDFRFRVEGRGVSDCKTITSGFRTFEVGEDGFFYLNGRKYWIRGGNHIPFAIRPNDRELADTFMQLMKQGNVEVTRTHTSPWNELWMDAADRNGIGVSFEGTWTWLFLHSTPIPDRTVLRLWHDEYLDLIRKYRNHPSLLFWTVNNEMKFYDNDEDLDRAKEKFTIISDVVKEIRGLDPTRPVCFDSNYQSKGKVEKFGREFMESVDDGDIDDVHGYYNWYDYSLFRFFNGEFSRLKMPGRPLISQEMSTGYPNNETGHPTRSYQLIHQNPMSLVGYDGYDWCDPSAFLNTQAFITKELAEAFRRSSPDASGIMHFSYMTWFRQCYDANQIEPYPTYYGLQKALQPVLVSAELWGRHFFEGTRLPVRICIVNDHTDGRALGPMLLRWEIVSETGQVLRNGIEKTGGVGYYERLWLEPDILLPVTGVPKQKVKLRLRLTEKGLALSENEYDLLLATRGWADAAPQNDKVFVVEEDTDISAQQLRRRIEAGENMVFLNCKELARAVFPEYITGWIIPTEGDIAFMERPEDPVFEGIDPLELRYFNNDRREIPLVCTTALKTVRCPEVRELAGQMKIHAYIDGGTQEDRLQRIDSMRGFPLVEISLGKGRALISTMCTDKADTDPIAAKLKNNLLTRYETCR